MHYLSEKYLEEIMFSVHFIPASCFMFAPNDKLEGLKAKAVIFIYLQREKYSGDKFMYFIFVAESG